MAILKFTGVHCAPTEFTMEIAGPYPFDDAISQAQVNIIHKNVYVFSLLAQFTHHSVLRHFESIYIEPLTSGTFCGELENFYHIFYFLLAYDRIKSKKFQFSSNYYMRHTHYKDYHASS